MPAIAPDDREWLAPVTLPTEQPVAQLEINRALTFAVFLQPIGDLRLGFRRWQAGEKPALHARPVAGESQRFPFRRLHHHVHG